MKQLTRCKPATHGGLLLSRAPMYDYLKARGSKVRDEYIEIGDWPVQFLSPSDDLERDAVENAVAATVDGVGTWVMTAEHLVAIALRTGRAKDHNRILRFMERAAVDREQMQSLLERHRLTAKWKQFEQRYLERHS